MTSAPAVDRRPVLPVDLGEHVRAVVSTTRSPVPEDEEPFNLGLSVGDDPGRVHARRSALDAEVGAVVAYSHQVHGRDVHHVRDPVPSGTPLVAVADALLTTRHDVALGVLAADCVPVLLADVRSPGAGVVGVAHAGRGGLVAGVVDALLDAMIEHGARPHRVRAVLGPAICGACYEVPAELAAAVDAVVPGTATTTRWGTPGLDVPRGVQQRLAARGVRVRQVLGCTLEDPRWFSHRGATGGRRVRVDAGPVGRLAGIVRLLPPGAGVSPRPGDGAGLA